MNSSKKNTFWTAVIVIIIVIGIILFVASLGKAEPFEVAVLPQEFKDSKEEAKRKHKRLQDLLDKKLELKSKLTKRFKNAYFAVRSIFVAIWLFYLWIVNHLGFIQNLGDALNYSELAILVAVTFNFITFGSLSNLNTFIDTIKQRLQNWIWGKYINIDEKIELTQTELLKAAEEIK